MSKFRNSDDEGKDISNKVNEECSFCNGERTHWSSDAIPCDNCNGTGVEP